MTLRHSNVIFSALLIILKHFSKSVRRMALDIKIDSVRENAAALYPCLALIALPVLQ
jgi:hypothetical protein